MDINTPIGYVLANVVQMLQFFFGNYTITCAMGTLVTFLKLGISFVDDILRKFQELSENYEITKNKTKPVADLRDIYFFHGQTRELSVKKSFYTERHLKLNYIYFRIVVEFNKVTENTISAI